MARRSCKIGLWSAWARSISEKHAGGIFQLIVWFKYDISDLVISMPSNRVRNPTGLTCATRIALVIIRCSVVTQSCKDLWAAFPRRCCIVETIFAQIDMLVTFNTHASTSILGIQVKYAFICSRDDRSLKRRVLSSIIYFGIHLDVNKFFFLLKPMLLFT